MSDVAFGPGATELIGPLDIFLAPAGTPKAIIDVDPDTCGDQTLVYGTADDAASVDAAVGTTLAEVGFGQGASLILSFTQPSANATWVAWIAVSTSLASDPTGWTKRNTTVDKDGVTLTVYTIDQLATDTDLSATVTFAGSALWRNFGYQDSCSISTSGVTITHSQTTNPVFCVGSPGPSKYVRTQEEYKVSFDLQDLSPETYAEVMESTVQRSATGAKVGTRSLRLHRSTVMRQYALLARGTGMSPYLPDEGNVQWYIPYVVQTGNPAPNFQKETPAMLAVEFSAVEDRTRGASARFGIVEYEETLRGSA